jgi:two-component system sensor kinase FixL
MTSQVETLGSFLPKSRSRSVILSASFLFIATIAYIDYRYFDVSLGILYVFPVMLSATVLNRWQIVLVSVACAVLRNQFLSSGSSVDALFRFLLACTAYSAGGMLIVETSRSRRQAEEHAEAMIAQERRRLEVEQHLQLLAESSPAAIFTADETGKLLSHNRAALEMFGVEELGELPNVGDYLPVLRDALALATRAAGFRTAAQCTGRRLNGEPFIAQIWFSVYESDSGRRLAAIAVDSSEDVREREERNLRQILDNNRIIAGAVSHEIRNICGAISMVYSNLNRDRMNYGELSTVEDFHALGNLVTGLSEIASSDLQAKVKKTLNPIALKPVLDDLRVVVEPAWHDQDGHVHWEIEPDLPLVFAEPFGLTQAMLNLTQNSLRAVQSRKRQELRIRAEARGRQVAILLEDSGPGIANPQHLFEPFQRASDHVGLGLYVSRALLRSYGGDLRYEPENGLCRFVAYLQVAGSSGKESRPIS